jgi:uncharacterized protein YbbC (DUF1343 family)
MSQKHYAINRKYMYTRYLLVVAIATAMMACKAQPAKTEKSQPALATEPAATIVQVGASRFQEYLPLIKGRPVALMVNQTSMVGKRHLVDSLKALGTDIKIILAPEHGFRGIADAGEHVSDGKDASTGIAVKSLYGSKVKPGLQDLDGVQVVIFDIQDVGVRFYTYISSLHYLMEACAEQGKELIVLDRPNPNIHRVDGPVLKKGFRSFIGVDPIPVLHGLTIGEYALMANAEGWLEGGVKCSLQVITCGNYTRKTPYDLPVNPSPNLKSSRAVFLYPSICFFEGTNVSVGRGTPFPFEVIGTPGIDSGTFSFTPVSMPGATNPPLINQLCKGYDLRKPTTEFGEEGDAMNLNYFMRMYSLFKDKSKFFLPINFIDKLYGSDELRLMVLQGKTAEEIRRSWQPELNNFKEKRKAYLLYK